MISKRMIRIGEKVTRAGKKMLPGEEKAGHAIRRFFQNRKRNLIICGILPLVCLPFWVELLFHRNLFIVEMLLSFIVFTAVGIFFASTSKMVSVKRYFAAAIMAAVIFIALTPVLVIPSVIVPDQMDRLPVVVRYHLIYGFVMFAPALIGSLFFGRFALHNDEV